LSLFVDTSVWSLAFRRDAPPKVPEVEALIEAIDSGGIIVTTGLVIQELLQGFAGPKARERIMNQFSAVPLIIPSRDDHIRAAELRNRCRRNGVQLGTVDVLLAELCIRHALTMLTTDKDFVRMAAQSSLKVWARVG
jgi:predicted nucleic acid-binding protein